jgi:hypothetical protein
MATIKSFRDVPPGGWRYVQPETAVRFYSDTFEDLAAQVRAHREYKGFSTATLARDIERQLCSGLSREHCVPEPGEDYRPVEDLTAQLTADKVKALSRALAAFVLGRAAWVSRAEAERRAAVCRGCPFNKPAKACACASAYTVVETLIPRERRLDGVSVCMACGCSLQAKANLPDEVIAASLAPGLALPEWCWQRAARSVARVEGASGK